jgi:uncharacterized protein YacL
METQANLYFQKNQFFLLKVIFLYFRIILMYLFQKLFLKNKKNYFNTFLNEKHFELQPQPQS